MLRCHLLVDARAASFCEVDSSKGLVFLGLRDLPQLQACAGHKRNLGGVEDPKADRAQ